VLVLNILFYVGYDMNYSNRQVGTVQKVTLQAALSCRRCRDGCSRHFILYLSSSLASITK